MPISQARTIAFDVLVRVAKEDAFADDVLRTELDENVKTENAALATELTMGVLRWQRLLDFFIDRSLTKISKTLDIEVRIALRLGIYQLLFLDRVPSRAAVHESVELVKRARKRSASALVNAVLRKAAGEQDSRNFSADTIEQLLPPDLSPVDRLGVRYSHPTWMIERWLRVYGEERTRDLLQANNRVPALSGYLLDPARGDEARRSLQEVGCRVQPGQLLRDAWSFEGGNPAASLAVRQGWVAIQDEASQAVAQLLGARSGETVLDLCAAPGGKTLLLARAVGPQGRVIAADLHEHRVRALRDRLQRAGVRNVETIVLDGAQELPFERAFDRILVDVPCSGTGTLSRHPEIRWKLRAEDLRDLHDRQTRLLRNALNLLAPGGRLVYSTCSLEPEENESVVRAALDGSESDFQVVDFEDTIKSRLLESVNAKSVFCADGCFRTFPADHRTDGFFAAAIKRNNPSA